MSLFRWSDAEWKSVGEGIRMKVLANGGNLMITVVEFDAGVTAPTHSHPHEQISYVLEGEFVYRLGGEEHRMVKGDSVYVPSGVEHNVTALTGGKLLDVFTPIRSDFL